MELSSSSGLRDRALGRLDGAVLALADAGAHHRLAHALHDRAHVGEVEVDLAGHGDDVADALHGLAQDVVRHPERLRDRRVAGHRLQQAVVGDGDHGVDALAELGEAVHGLGHAPLALQGEGQGHHRHGEHAAAVAAELAGDGGHHRRGAGAGAAAEAGGDEDHVRALEGVADLLRVLDRGLPPDVGVGARAQALGQLAADLDLHRRAVLAQRLQVGVDGDELDALEAGRDHAADGVAAPAADAHHLDARPARLVVGEGDAARPVVRVTFVIQVSSSNPFRASGHEAAPQTDPLAVRGDDRGAAHLAAQLTGSRGSSTPGGWPPARRRRTYGTGGITAPSLTSSHPPPVGESP